MQQHFQTALLSLKQLIFSANYLPSNFNQLERPIKAKTINKLLSRVFGKKSLENLIKSLKLSKIFSWQHGINPMSRLQFSPRFKNSIKACVNYCKPISLPCCIIKVIKKILVECICEHFEHHFLKLMTFVGINPMVN